MTSNTSRGRPSDGFAGLLRAVALIGVLAGAVGSIGLMLHVAHRQNSRILLVLFAIWAPSPFMALVWANVISVRWPARTRTTLYWVTLVLTLGSVAIYGYVAFGPPRAKPAAEFLIVPLASWLVIAMAVLIKAKISGKRSGRGSSA